MLRVGLTGGIASGKSHVLSRLAAAGFATLDLDVVAHELMAPDGPAHRPVVEAFGRELLDAEGRIDRRRLGARVFSDPAARRRLDAIVHPLVREEEARRIASLPSGPSTVVVTDAALLVEAGVHLRFDRLLVVHCRPEQQVERLMSRGGLDLPAARARVDAQMPAEEKRRFAHFEIDTRGSLAETDRQVSNLVERLTRLARTPRVPFAVGLPRAAGCLLRSPARGPRGLDAVVVAEEAGSVGGLEMERVARRLSPPSPGPWFRAAEDDPEPGPETLVAPLVVQTLTRHGPDREYLLGAAASLARLTHVGPGRVADACFYARALLEGALQGAHPVGEIPEAWVADAVRWAGEPPSDRMRRVVAETPGGSERPGLAGALVAISEGVPPESVPSRIRDAAARLLT